MTTIVRCIGHTLAPAVRERGLTDRVLLGESSPPSDCIDSAPPPPTTPTREESTGFHITEPEALSGEVT